MARSPVLNGIVNPARPGDVARFGRDVANLIDQPLVRGYVTAGDQASNTRAITIQMRDRLLVPWPRRWLVLIYIADAAGGDPQNGQTVTFTTGTVVQQITANQAWWVLTDDDGVVEMDVDVTGPDSRWFAVAAEGWVEESAEIAWL